MLSLMIVIRSVRGMVLEPLRMLSSGPLRLVCSEPLGMLCRGPLDCFTWVHLGCFARGLLCLKTSSIRFLDLSSQKHRKNAKSAC